MKVVVVGAGVFGAWAAKFLRDAGHRVTLLDAYGAANGRASSADHSRVIRSGYGADEIYSQWAARAWDDWSWLSQAVGDQLVVRTGALFMGPAESAYIRESYAMLTRLGLAAEWLEPADVQRRYPQIDLGGLGSSILERDAGVIFARAAVRALVNLLRKGGVDYRIDRIAPLDEQSTTCVVRAEGGAVYEADAYVFASGPWLPTLFPQAVGGRIRPTRQEVLYFGVPGGSTRFSVPQLPVWIDFPAGLYGIPDVEGHGFKVGIDRHGPLVDPETLDRIVAENVVSSTRSWLATRFPGLRDAPLVEARVCQYENTASGDFIIDRHPMWPHVWIAGGGSGHGFKHGPSIGRHVAALVDGHAKAMPRFSLAARSETFARAVF